MGAGGRISGFIQTNGASGVLTPSDLVDWNLELDADGDGSATRLLGPQSGANSVVVIQDGGLTATPAGLFFEFTGPGSPLLQIHSFNRSIFWQFVGDGVFDELIREADGNQVNFEHPAERQQIGAALGAPYALGATVARLRINDAPDERLRVRVLFNPTSCGDGIDPATEPVTLTLSTLAGTFYPVVANVFPMQPGELVLQLVDGVRTWHLSPAGRARTGIERLDIDEGDGSIVLVDRHANLPAQPYESVRAQLTIGNDSGEASATPVEEPCGSGRWRAGR